MTHEYARQHYAIPCIVLKNPYVFNKQDEHNSSYFQNVKDRLHYPITKLIKNPYPNHIITQNYYLASKLLHTIFSGMPIVLIRNIKRLARTWIGVSVPPSIDMQGMEIFFTHYVEMLRSLVSEWRCYADVCMMKSEPAFFADTF